METPRNEKLIQEDLRLLNLQIQAVFDSDMHAQDRRIILEGYATQKDNLDEELRRSKAIGNLEVEAEPVLADKPEQRGADS